MKKKRILILILCLAGLSLFAVFADYYVKASPGITWSRRAIEVTAFPGQAKTETITFSSSEDLKNAVIEVTPSLRRFLSLEPGAFTAVSKNTPQSLQLRISIPAGTAFSSYGGTVKVRSSNRTLATPLKLAISIGAQINTNEQIGVSTGYPYDWFTRNHLGYFVFSNVSVFGTTEPRNANEAYFALNRRLNVNPQRLPIQHWYEATITPNEPSPASDKENVTVNGTSGFRMKSEGVGTFYHVFLPDGQDVVEIVYSGDTPAFNGVYETMLSSITMIP